MNNLSWLIYLIQITDGLRILCGMILMIGAAGLMFGGMLTFFNCQERDVKFMDSWWPKTAKRCAFAVPFLVAFIVFAPSRETMILVAGSELGQRAMQSEDVKSIVNPGLELLKTWIRAETDKILKGEKK